MSAPTAPARPVRPDLQRARTRPRPFPRRRVKVPTVLQMEETECGAASLGMVLAHFGRLVPLEELRDACGVSRDGSNASAMLKAARGYGMEAKGYRRPFAKLAEGDLLPQILFWRYSHWVVLEGYGQDCLSTSTTRPRAGARSRCADAERLYSGVALHAAARARLRHAEASARAGSRTCGADASRRGWASSSRPSPACSWWCPGSCCRCSPRCSWTTFSTPRPPGTPPGSSSPSSSSSLLIGVLTLVQQWFLARLQTRLTVSGSFRLVDHLLKLPVQYFTQRFPGRHRQPARPARQHLAAARRPAGHGRRRHRGLVVYAVVMFAFSPLLAALAIFASLLNVAALWYVSRRRDAANQLQLRESARLTGLGMSMVSNIEAVKTAGAEDSAFERWAGFQARYLLASQEMGRLTNGSPSSRRRWPA